MFASRIRDFRGLDRLDVANEKVIGERHITQENIQIKYKRISSGKRYCANKFGDIW